MPLLSDEEQASEARRARRGTRAGWGGGARRGATGE